jgi:Tfp pilus assembly protein PilF
MTKRIALFLQFAVLIAGLSFSAVARESAVIKGVCRNEFGKPLAGASIEISNSETGATNKVSTGDKGDYKSPGLAAGSYKVTLFGADGKPLFYFSGVPAKADSTTQVDFDFAKLKPQIDEQNAANEKLRQQNEKVAQENEKIRAVNALLQQAAEQKQNKQYAAAVATLQQAAAQDQTHDVVYASLADAYMLNQQFPEAAEAYSKAIALASAGSKSLASYHAELGLAFVQEGKNEDSSAECNKAAQLDAAQGSQCYFNEGAILTNRGQLDAANQAFDNSIAADPARADAYYQKGVNLLTKATLGSDNKMTPAPGTVEALRKYLELAPEGKYAQSAKDLLASFGATVETSYGASKKSKK